MEKENLTATVSSPENSNGNSVCCSKNGEYYPLIRKYDRSKSMSQIEIEQFTPGEIRRIQERLLRTTSHVETSAIKRFSRSQKATLACLALVDFMSFCSMSIMAPFFPKEAADKGLSDTLSGFIFSFYALVQFLTSPIFGKIIPTVGAKFLFLTGMLVTGVCNILFGLLGTVEDYTTFTVLCIVVRGFEALGASAFSTASYVFVVNSFPHSIASVLGILETFVGLGMSTGPAVGGLLYSVGGFGMPFLVLGLAIIFIVPISLYLLPMVHDEDFNVNTKSPSLFSLLKVPAVVVTGLVVVVVSSTWAFLDPTLEPHLRQFKLSPEKIGLIFLLFSGLYGIFSPLWGWVADKVHNHWSMMVIGLAMSTVGLLILGPCPFLPIQSAIWLDIVALSLLGVSVALALLPTFPGVLTSAIDSGCGDSLATYSIVAGVWSCMYSLGEVVGPSLGGFLLDQYGFPILSTVMAFMTAIMSIVTFVFFWIRGSNCSDREYSLDSGISESWKSSNTEIDSETTPLLKTAIDSSNFMHPRLYTEDKVQNYGLSRQLDKEHGEHDYNQVTDIRGTVMITSKGSCEV